MALAVPHVGGNATQGTITQTSDSWTSTAGSLIVVMASTFDAISAFTAGECTDSKSNTYTLIGQRNGGSLAMGTALWYTNNNTRGATHTVTIDLTPQTGGRFVNLGVVEITGQALTSPLDSTTFATAVDTTSPFTVTSAAAIVGNQIAVYGAVINGSSSAAWTQPTGYTNIINQGNGAADNLFDNAYKINETGTPSPGAAYTAGNTDAVEIFATFKEAVVAPSGLKPFNPIPFQAQGRNL